jgi:hypothetical protein
LTEPIFPPIGTGPDAGTLTGKVSTALPTEVDVPALLAQMQAQQAAMAAEIARLRAGQAPQGVHPLILAAQDARGLIAAHIDMGGGRNSGPDLLRLADDTVDAAHNAVASGDTGPVRAIAQRLERALKRVHPGAGDHHYFTQAMYMVGDNIPSFADEVTAPSPSSAPALTSDRGSVPVIAGSVTG